MPAGCYRGRPVRRWLRRSSHVHALPYSTLPMPTPDIAPAPDGEGAVRAVADATGRRRPGSRPGRARRLSDEVADRLQAFIAANALEDGARLPSERELCDLLGVSRTVVREAVRSLAAKGLLEVRQGDGTVVRTPSVQLASDVMTVMLRGHSVMAFTAVHEVRRLLEVEIAGLAAERRTEVDMTVIAARLAAADEHADDHERWAEADVAFHAALAAATHNPLFAVLLSSMAGMLTELRRTAARLPGTPARAREHHAALVAAIGDGNGAAARRAMVAHMAEAEETFRRARFVGLATEERPAQGGVRS